MIGNFGEGDGPAHSGASSVTEEKFAQLRSGEAATAGIFHFLQGLAHLQLLLIEQSRSSLIEQSPVVDRLLVFGFRSETREGDACRRVFAVDYLLASIIKLSVNIEGRSGAGRRRNVRRRSMADEKNPTEKY